MSVHNDECSRPLITTNKMHENMDKTCKLIQEDQCLRIHQLSHMAGWNQLWKLPRGPHRKLEHALHWCKVCPLPPLALNIWSEAWCFEVNYEFYETTQLLPLGSLDHYGQWFLTGPAYTIHPPKKKKKMHACTHTLSLSTQVPWISRYNRTRIPSQHDFWGKWTPEDYFMYHQKKKKTFM